MFIELVDALRCPRPHEESWLVLAATRLEARHVREGALGCPVCRAEYPIRDGIADFSLDMPRNAADRTRSAGEGSIQDVGAGDLAALLDLGDALGFVVLVGAWGHRADALLAEIEGLSDEEAGALFLAESALHADPAPPREARP